MRLGCDTSTNGLGLAPTLAVARNSQNNIANLPKYAVQGRGATKPPAPESPRTASLKPTLVLCLATVYCTQSWGEGPTLRESPYRDSCTFEALAKQQKMPLTTVAISTDQCTARAESVQGARKPL